MFGRIENPQKSCRTPFALKKKCWHGSLSQTMATLGSFFFEDDRGNIVTTTKKNFSPVLEHFWEELAEREDLGEEEQWF